MPPFSSGGFGSLWRSVVRKYGERSFRALMEIALHSYIVGTLSSALLAFAVGKRRGVRGLKLLFGAVMLSASWPLWGVGAILLSIIGIALTVAALVTLVIVGVGLLVAALWIIALIKTLEILGWCCE